MIDLRIVPFGHPDVQRLVLDIQAEYAEIYGGGDDTPLDLDEFDPPVGAFLLAYDDGYPVAMGGWRLRPDVRALGGVRAAEVKRMYVVPTHRRKGLAQLTLSRLEDSAREAGADVMVLETGLPQSGAVALYDSAGYVDAGLRFGFYAESEHAIYLAKRLPITPAAPELDDRGREEPGLGPRGRGPDRSQPTSLPGTPPNNDPR